MTFMDLAGKVLLPGGILSALIVFVVFYMRQTATDRQDYRKALADAESQNTADLKVLRDQHAEEMNAVRAELNDLRSRVKTLEDELDAERERRRKVEDERDAWRRAAQDAGVQNP